MEKPSRRAVLVLGIHRSGTSVLTHAVSLLGAALPKTLMPPQPDNPDGFWEPMPVMQLNEQILRDADRTWDDPRPIEPAWWNNKKKQAHHISLAKEVLSSEFQDAGYFVLKDPRISRLLPIWLEAMKGLGVNPYVLISCRNPLEVASSLFKRNGLNLKRSQLIWLDYMLEAEAATRSLPRATVRFDDLLADWRGEFNKANRILKLDELAVDGVESQDLEGLFTPRKRNHQSSTEELLQDERISPLLKETWKAFLSEPLPTAATFDKLRARLIDAWATTEMGSKLVNIRKPKTPKVLKAASAAPGGDFKQPAAGRHVILHYHLFKNAGTSLDHILKQNFKAGWHEQEGPNPGWRPESIAEFILQHPKIVVLSSHTALLPPPVLPGLTVYPVIFVRHPIDRIRSIYEFERKQIAETDGARMAKQTDMAGYIKWRLNRPGDRAIRNFQAYRLAFGTPAMQEGRRLGEGERALKTVETLPFIGVVEKFDESLAKLQAWLKPVFPEIDFKPTKANITQKDETTLEGRLQEIRKTIGDDLYAELLKANELDLEVYEKTVAISVAGGK